MIPIWGLILSILVSIWIGAFGGIALVYHYMKLERKMHREGRERYERLTREIARKNKMDTEAFKFIVGVKE